jgi:hypothetical protein
MFLQDTRRDMIRAQVEGAKRNPSQFTEQHNGGRTFLSADFCGRVGKPALLLPVIARAGPLPRMVKNFILYRSRSCLFGTLGKIIAPDAIVAVASAKPLCYEVERAG